MTLGRRKVAMLAAGAVAAAGITAGAVAATGGSTDQASDLAAAINKRAGTSITADDVTGAFQDLLKTRLDEAVAAGRITQEQADQMLARAKDAPGLPGFGGPGHGPGGPGFGARGAVSDAVAKKLGMTEDALRTQLRSGKTLTAIAKAKGVEKADLVATIAAALKAEGVPDARATALATRIADGKGPDGRGPGERHHMGPPPGGMFP